MLERQRILLSDLFLILEKICVAFYLNSFWMSDGRFSVLNNSAWTSICAQKNMRVRRELEERTQIFRVQLREHCRGRLKVQ